MIDIMTKSMKSLKDFLYMIFQTIPVWLLFTYIFRVLLGSNFFKVPYITAALLLLSAIFVYITNKKTAVQQLQGPNTGSKWCKVYTLIFMLLIGYVLYDLASSYYNYYFRTITLLNETGFSSLRSADFALHTSISNYLKVHPLLIENPFYYGAATTYHHFFDMLVANVSILFSTSINTSFYIITPLLLLLSVVFIAWHMVLRVHSFVGKLLLIIGFYVFCKYDFVPYYNIFGICYSVFLATEFWDTVNTSLETKTRNYIAIQLLFLANLAFILQSKVFYFLAVMIGLLGYVTLNFRTIKKNQLLLFVFPFLVVILYFIFFMVLFNENSRFYTLCFDWKWVHDRLILLKPSLIILAAIFILSLVAYKRSASLLYSIISAVGFSICIFLYPTQYEGGASFFYPLEIAKFFELLAIIFLYDSFDNVFFTRLSKFIIPVGCVFFMYYGYELNSLDVVRPFKVLGNDSITGPNRDALQVFSKLNEMAQKDDVVITNSWRLNRYYSFPTFSIVTPFISSPQYAAIGHLKDYDYRKGLLVSLFDQKDEREVEKAYRSIISNKYHLRFLFIDNSLLKVQRPSEVSPAEWENILYTDAADKGVSMIECRSIRNNLMFGIKKGFLKIIYKNNSATLYEFIRASAI